MLEINNEIVQLSRNESEQDLGAVINNKLTFYDINKIVSWDYKIICTS